MRFSNWFEIDSYFICKKTWKIFDIFIYLSDYSIFYQIILYLFRLLNTLSNFICRLSIHVVTLKSIFLQSYTREEETRDIDLICTNQTLNAVKSNGHKAFDSFFYIRQGQIYIGLIIQYKANIIIN